MAISTEQRVDYLFKKLGYGLTKTDTNDNKKAPNENIPSPLLLRGDKVWQQAGEIPSVKPSSSASPITIYSGSSTVECTEDNTATADRTWKTGITDWIPPEFGATYLVSVFVHTSGDAANAESSGTRLFVTGSGNDDEWFFDYQSGVLNFIGDNYPNAISDWTGKSVYISGAVYTGSFGVGSSAGQDAELGNLVISDTTISTATSGDDIILQPDGDGTLIIDTNTALQLPTGTNVERPSAPVEGQIRFNEDTSKVEVYDGTDWVSVGGTSGAISTQAFSGDGSTTDFTLNSDADSATVMVTLNGVVQEPTVAYTVSGTTLSFSEAPSATDRIEVRKLGVLSTIRSLVDSDSDTSIQVEASADEDVVRLTASGTNTLSVSSSYIRADSGYTPTNNYDLTTKTYVDSSISSISLDLSSVNQSIIPDADETYDLGSSTYKWRDLYLSGSSIKLGNATITASGTALVLPTGTTLGGVNAATETYVDTAESDAISSANGYTDTREIAITTAYQTYADTAESDAITTANNYTDAREIAITTAYQTYADTAESDAITTANSYTDTEIANLVDSAPATLDTLNELAAALGDDPNYATTVSTALGNRLASNATVTLSGDVTGTASFSSNTATITTTIQANSVALGIDTTGNYVQQGATSGNGLSGSVNSEGGTFTVTSNATDANTPSTIVFRDSSGNFSAGTITATATTAQYADLAELYLTDEEYEPGTVVVFGGGKEVTACIRDNDHTVAGVISTDPALTMNSDLENGTAIALTGRVPVKVEGEVSPGDLIVTSNKKGYGMVNNNARSGTILGKVISRISDNLVEVLIILA